MKKLTFVVLVLFAALAISTPASACYSCNGTNCYSDSQGAQICTQNLGTCWTSGSWCYGVPCPPNTPGCNNEIERVKPRGPWYQRLLDMFTPVAEAATHDNHGLAAIKDRCNATPGCTWFSDGQSGGYGQTWGKLTVLHR